MSITPDGRLIYLPSLEAPHWNVVRAEDGEMVDKIVVDWPRTTRSADPRASRPTSPVSFAPVRVVAPKPACQDRRSVWLQHPALHHQRRRTLCFVNVNDLLGFEVGDLASGEKLHRVEVPGFEKGPAKRHGCPSHGIGLTPDEKELWLTDAHNSRLHIFDATVMPPRQLASIPARPARLDHLQRRRPVRLSLDG